MLAQQENVFGGELKLAGNCRGRISEGEFGQFATPASS
jgi:hypothetical protein